MRKMQSKPARTEVADHKWIDPAEIVVSVALSKDSVKDCVGEEKSGCDVICRNLTNQKNYSVIC